jgi:hypothetical protein
MAVPSHPGKLDMLVVDTIFNAVRYVDKNLPHVQIDMRWMRRAMIDRARQQVHDYALENNYDYIQWWDDDILAPSDTIARLLSHDKDVVSGMAFVRTPPHPMYAYKASDLDDLETFKSITLSERDGLMEVDAVGTGCMLMRTRVVDGLDKPYWLWPEKGAEDISLCVRLRKQGVQIYCDTDVELVHLDYDPNAITKDSHLAQCQEMAAMIKVKPEIKDHPEFYKVGYLIDGASA